MYTLLTVKPDNSTDILRQPSLPVMSLEEALPVVTGMKEWCKAHNYKLSGLSAVQLGVLLRIAFIWHQGLEVVMINPDIVYQKGEQNSGEGCLSLPGRIFIVKRPKIVKVRYLDESWTPHSLKGHDFTAAAIMHEVDHLDGQLIDKPRERGLP
jgi:peptide deformylase